MNPGTSLPEFGPASEGTFLEQVLHLCTSLLPGRSSDKVALRITTHEFEPLQRPESMRTLEIIGGFRVMLNQ